MGCPGKNKTCRRLYHAKPQAGEPVRDGLAVASVNSKPLLLQISYESEGGDSYQSILDVGRKDWTSGASIAATANCSRSAHFSSHFPWKPVSSFIDFSRRSIMDGIINHVSKIKTVPILMTDP